jgi:hypothetical protein
MILNAKNGYAKLQPANVATLTGIEKNEFDLVVTCTLADYVGQSNIADVTGTHNYKIFVRPQLGTRRLADEDDCENDFFELEEPFVAD